MKYVLSIYFIRANGLNYTYYPFINKLVRVHKDLFRAYNIHSFKGIGISLIQTRLSLIIPVFIYSQCVLVLNLI